MKIIPVLSAIATSVALTVTLSAIAKAGDSNCPNGNCDVNTPINTGGNKPSNSAVHLQQPSTDISNSNSGQATGQVGQSQSAFMSNQQYNLQGYYPEYGFGPGISCPDIGLTIAGTTSAGGGGDVYSWGDTMVMGGAVSLNIPLGNTGKICRDFARTIVGQRKYDTCIGIFKSGLDINYALAPELEYCKAFTPRAVAVVVPEPAPVPTPDPPAPEPPPVYSAPPTKVLY